MSAGWPHLIARELRLEIRPPHPRRTRLLLTLFWASLCFWSIAAPQAALSLSFKGHRLFMILSMLSIGLCAVAGLFQMAAWLSVEQRRGTLALLLQTRVTRSEVLLSSFTAKFIQALLMILPVAPFLLFTLTLGGTSLLEICRILLILLVTLFASLAFATLGATLGQTERSALLITLIFLLAINIGLPLAGKIWDCIQPLPGYLAWLFSLSPSVALSRAAEHEFLRDPARFYTALLVQFLGGVGCLIWAGRRFAPYRLTIATHSTRSIRWFGVCLPWLAFGMILMTLRHGNRMACEYALAALYLVHLALKVWLTLEASMLLYEERQTGALLLELGTLSTVAEVLHRHQRILWRQFRWPMISTGLANLVTIIVVFGQNDQLVNSEAKLMLAAILMVGILALVTDSYGLFWLGISSGLKSDRVSGALLRTFTEIILLPWACVWALSALNLGTLYTPNEYNAYFLCWVTLGFSLSLIVGAAAKHRLNRDLAEWFMPKSATFQN